MFGIVISCLISAAIAVGIGVFSARKIIVIKFNYTPLYWIEPIIYSFSAIIILAAFEYGGVKFFLKHVSLDNKIVYIMAKVLENGYLIPLICVLVSRLFEKIVESLNFDYLEFYSEMVAKICFSTMAISLCFMFLQLLIPYIGTEDLEVDYLLNRILMWLLTVIGTFFGIGFGCKGRIESENKKIRAINSGLPLQKKLIFWRPILLSLLVPIAILIFTSARVLDPYLVNIWFAALSFLVTGMITVMVTQRIYYPSEEMSRKYFYKAIGEMKDGKSSYHRFGRIEYKLENNKIIIRDTPVYYEEHEDDSEFRVLFREKEIEIVDLDKTREMLIDMNRKQKDYIRKGYEDCVEALRRDKLESISKEK